MATPLTDANRPIAGIFWMVVTGIMFVAVTAVVKHGGDRLPAAQSAFLRYFLGLVFLIPMIRPIRAAHLTRRQITLFAWRGVAHTLAVICWFYAMTRISIAEVTAMNYLSPVYVTIGAAFLLKEALPPRRLVAVLVALLGALIILRPGLRELNDGHLAMVFTALAFAVGYLIAKQLAGEVSAAGRSSSDRNCPSMDFFTCLASIIIPSSTARPLSGRSEGCCWR